MATKATHAYGERIMTAWNALAPRQRNELFATHERAYRMVEMMGAGLIDPDALTEAGSAEVDKLGGALAVDPDVATEKPKRGAKKDESNQ